MKELLLQYAAYNLWANGLLLDAIAQLPPEKQRQEAATSFGSLYATVLHLLDAESLWWQRLKLVEHAVRPSDTFAGDMRMLSQQLLEQDKRWQEWIANATPHMLAHQFKYQNSKRESFKQPIYQMLLHLFNHGTYHRGQLVALLRHAGLQKLPATDFIVWSRTKAFAKLTG